MPLRPTIKPPSPAAALTAKLDAGRRAFADARLEEAKSAFEAILRAIPAHSESHVFLSRIAWETGDRDSCLTHLEQAATLAPENPRAQMALAERYGQIGETDKALAAYDRANRISPAKSIAPKAEKARFLQGLGRFDEAEAIFQKLIKRHPGEAELYRIYLGGKKSSKGDAVLRQMRKLWSDKALSDEGRMHLGYALAKALDETGDTDKVMAVLNRTNAIQKRLAPYDRRAREAEWIDLRIAQDGADLTPVDGQMSPRLVVVCGMPRSGTTLVEQIIARHDDAAAGGEMGHILRVALRQFETHGTIRPLATLDPSALTSYREAIARLVFRDTGMAHGVVTDKSIRNFQIFGLIHRALPDARLVVVHRDPRDIALSMWRNYFHLGTHRYANDWADIADEIKRFRRVVALWRDRLPGAIHDIRYEDLVSDPEPQARALLDAAGLDWQDQVLDSTATRGSVQTLSLAQVRAPIHAGRREAWRKYETDMAPFIEAWGDEPWD